MKPWFGFVASALLLRSRSTGILFRVDDLQSPGPTPVARVSSSTCRKRWKVESWKRQKIWHTQPMMSRRIRLGQGISAMRLQRTLLAGGQRRTRQRRAPRLDVGGWVCSTTRHL